MNIRDKREEKHTKLSQYDGDWHCIQTQTCLIGFIVYGNKYKLLGGNADYSAYSGLTNFNPYNNHDICYLYANTGFLWCATKEIAKHFGKYFAKEIFDAKYGNFIEYQWL